MRAQLDTELPAAVATGNGTCIFLAGSFAGEARVRRLALRLDGDPDTAVAAIRGGRGPTGTRFWGFLPLPSVSEPRAARIELVAILSGRHHHIDEIAAIRLLPAREAADRPARAPTGAGPLVAICMATHEPPADLLRRQLESIRDQDHRRWICLISDDCSTPAAFERLRGLVGDDERFTISRASEHRGHYGNFERALTMVPAEADFVALSDQDDRWHPDKLSTLLVAIGASNLAYSDMRIVDRDGAALADTFWTYKRNNYDNLSSLLLDNTVTGAASLFARRLLDWALPFPPETGASYHDHWLAGVALATGRLAYVERPLYDYSQHASAATPLHPSAGEPATGPREGRLAEGREAYLRILSPVVVAARTLELRSVPFRDRGAQRAVRRVARLGEPPEPVPWLLWRCLRPLVGRNETLYTERALLKAIAWRRLSAASGSRSPQPSR